MDLKILTAAGLTEEEAQVYLLLLERGSLTAGELLESVKMKRSTLYQLLRGLESRGLVVEKEIRKKLRFSPAAPDILLDRAHERRVAAEKAEASLAEQLPILKTKFLVSVQKPVIRYYEGVEGLKQLYEAHLESGTDMYFIRTREAYTYRELFGKWWAHYLRRRAKKNIQSFGLTPDDPHANHDPKNDASFKVVRTWLRPEDYEAPIEIAAFGDIVAIISYDNEIFGFTIENKSVARAFRQMFRLMELGAKTIEVKHDHE